MASPGDRNKRTPANARKNKGARPAQIPRFLSPELCKLVAKAPDGKAWGHEIKYDGYRIQMRVANRLCTLRTRKGLNWTKQFPEIASEGASLSPCLIDGEICAMDQRGISNFGLLQNASSGDTTGKLIFFAFDLMFDSTGDLRQLSLIERKRRLKQLLHVRGKTLRRLRYVPLRLIAGPAALKSACRAGLEGIVSKRMVSSYRAGRGGDWTKAKCRGGQEVVIGGWTGKAPHLASLLVGAYRDRKLVYFGRVGTGFNTKVMADLLMRLKKLTRTRSPFDPKVVPPHADKAHWVRAKLVAEIEYENITAAGVLRQPSFKGLRLDKPAHSIVPEFLKRKNTV